MGRLSTTECTYLPTSRANDPWSYAARIVTPSWLGPLPRGDMVFPTWPKMAKTVKIWLNGPHSRSLVSMVMASKNLTIVAIDTWDGCVQPLSKVKGDLKSRHEPSSNRVYPLVLSPRDRRAMGGSI